MRRALVGLLGLAASLVVVTWWRLAVLPDGMADATALPATSVTLAFHVHTSRSDGTGTVEEIAAAAAAAGVRVVVLTDHDDGTRVPDPPRYLAGVLILDGIEIGTWGGHYVAVGARPSPYPLGGAPDTVVEDVARLGGFGVAAHPGSSKDDLRWRGWDAPFDGLEWLNADSEWRDRPGDLWTALVTYPWRAPATLASLLHRPVFELREWDRRTAQRPVVGLAAHDAHARLGLRGASEPYDGWVAWRAPGYAPMFRAFTTVLQVSQPLDPNAAQAAAAVLEALRNGAAYTVVTAGHSPPDLQFTATSGGRQATIGQHLAAVGAVTLTSAVAAPDDAMSTLVCDGRPVTSTRGGRLTWTADRPPGACRLEVSLGGSDVAPWIVTNPIYSRPVLVASGPTLLAPPRVIVPIAGTGRPNRWTIETSVGSSAAVTADTMGNRIRAQWRLGPHRHDFAAVQTPATALRDFDRLILRAAASGPMRLWIQLRTPANGGRRWGRTVYLDATPRQLELPFSTFRPLDPEASGEVPLDQVSALLLVVDTVHARPGDSGVVTVDELWLAQ